MDNSDVQQVISPAKRQIACERAIKEKGSFHDIIVHGVCSGFPRAGKSSFKERLVGRFRVNSNSTGVAEKPVKIEVTAMVLVDEQKWTDVGSMAEETTTVADKVTINISKNPPAIGKVPLPTAIERKVEDEAKTSKSKPSVPTPSIPTPVTVNPFQAIVDSASNKGPEFPTMVAASQGVTAPRDYEKTWTHYMSDVGGQLEFQQLYPNLLSGPSLFYYTLKANQEFDKKYDVEYLHSGNSTVPYKASTTTRESILQFLASITSIKKMSRTNEGLPAEPKVLFIATHIDKLSSEDEIDKIDKKLQEIVRGTQAFKDHMIIHNSESQMLFPIDNVSDTDGANKKIQHVKKVVHEVVVKNKEYHFDIPYTWAIFSFTVQNHPDQVLHYDTCLEMGKECGIESEEDLDDCLWYLHHRTGILRYYGDVPKLRHLIFKEAQYIFDGVTNIITNTFTFDNVTHILSVQEEFEKKGIFSYERFKKIYENMRSKSELVSPEQFIELLKYIRILAAYSKKETNTTMYFLPCSLVHTEEVPECSSEFLPSLHFTFEIGFCPIGLFGALVADLLLSCDSDSDIKWCFEEEQVYRNQISFLVGPYSDQFRISATSSFISVDISENPAASKAHRHVLLAKICCHVKSRLSSSLAAMIEKLNYDPVKARGSLAFLCPGISTETCRPTIHSAVITLYDDIPCMLKCPYSRKDVLELPHNYKIWFEKDYVPQSESNFVYVPKVTPSNFTLIKWKSDEGVNNFKLIEKISDKWQEIGTLLELEQAKLKLFRDTSSNNAEICLREVLSHWLEGGGSRYPRTWDGVCTLLRDIHCANIAEELKQALENSVF